MYRLYVKQSLPFETICDLLELKKLDVVKALEKEMDDDELKEALKSVYSKASETLKGEDLVKKIAEQLGLEYEKPKDAEANVYSPNFASDFYDPVPCPACKGVGWTVLFMYRSNCKLCEGKCEVDGVVFREYTEKNETSS